MVDMTLAWAVMAALCAAAIVAGGCWILELIRDIAGHDD